MLLVEFNEKIRAIRIPESYEDFKKAVIKEYSIPSEKISKIFFSFRDNDNNTIYITNEEDFFNALPNAEEIVFNIEFKENQNSKKEASIDSLLSKGNIDAIIEKANKRILELKKETNNLKNEEIKLKSKNNKTNKTHGINCNICNNLIRGIRYKCGVCKNYNLCEICENKIGLEHNHPLLKIRKPELCPIEFVCSLKE